MSVKIIGIVGLVGAGKDTAASYLKNKYNYEIISYSDLVHEKVKEENLVPTRENLQKIAKKYRELYGMDYFARLAVEKAVKALATGHEKIILKELRKKEDVEYPKKYFKNFYVIEIYADQKIRFERLKKRKSSKDPATWEEFLKQEENEKLLGFHEALQYADFIINNNGSLEELYSNLDEIVKRIEITRVKWRRKKKRTRKKK